MKSSQQWTQVIDEILRTAATSTKLRPVLDRALDALKAQNMTCARLKELSDDVANCRNGMRPHEVQPAEDLCTEQLRTAAERYIDMTDEQVLEFSVTSEDLQCILNGLQNFKEKPGVFDLIKEVREWLAEHQKSMTLADLIDVANRSSMSGVVGDLNHLQQLMTRCVKVKVPESTVPAVTLLLASALRAFLAEAGCHTVDVHGNQNVLQH